MIRSSEARHEIVDHTSEMTLRLRAPTFPALVTEATKGFVGLVPEGVSHTPDDTWRELRVSGTDREAMLVAWLNELVYLCDVERWLPEEIEAVEEQGAQLRVRTRGTVLDEPFVLVKAATLHDAHIRGVDGDLQVEVTLDV